MKNYLSVAVFNDLRNIFEDTIEFTDKSQLDELVPQLMLKAKPYIRYYDDLFDFEENSIVSELTSGDFYVWNRYEKYYVIAFAINFKQFNIYSKDLMLK